MQLASPKERKAYIKEYYEKNKNKYKCEHGIVKYTCKEFGGNSICKHGKIKTICKDCRGGSICAHDKVKSQCR